MADVRILMVDDDVALARGVRVGLMNAGYVVETAVDGLAGLKAARRLLPDLIILDVNMPWMDGLELCARLRQEKQLQATPILFLTSRDTVSERVAGLDQGADDYLTKPFDMSELKARIRALLRRGDHGNGESNDQIVQVGALSLDLQSCHVRVNGRDAIQLTPAEFELLHYLMRHPSQPFSSDDLLERVWAYQPGTADPSLARYHIRNLRKKIEADPNNPVFIRTVPRHGYVLERPS